MTDITAVIPALMDDIRLTERDGKITLSFLSVRSGSMLSRVLRRYSKTTTIELDEIGSYVIAHTNGCNTVKDIMLLAKRQYPKEKQLDERVIIFLTALRKHRIIKYLAKCECSNNQASDGCEV